MTDEERQKLCATLRRMPGMLRHDCIRAAEEIERLAEELRISNKALSMCSDECNRCYELAERSDARYEEKIKRLNAELADARRLLEINRRRSLEKSGGLEIKQSKQ